MSEVVGDNLFKGIARDLEVEHGDLRSATYEKPPLSRLGSAIVNSRRPYAARELVDDLARRATKNTALARLRVEYIHENMAAIEEAEALPGSLPHAVVDYFEAGLSSIQEQDSFDAELGIRALALWADAIETQTVIENDLLSWLVSYGGIERSKCSIARVLHATKRFLTAGKSDDPPLMGYNRDFQTFVTARQCEVVRSMRNKLAKIKAHVAEDELDTEEQSGGGQSGV